MKKDDSVYLKHILDAISRIEEYTHNIKYEDFMNNYLIHGDNVTLVGSLIVPIAMEKGVRFAIREGGKTVGAGVVTKVIE